MVVLSQLSSSASSTSKVRLWGRTPGVSDVREVEAHDGVPLWQVRLLEQPLDLVFATQI